MTNAVTPIVSCRLCGDGHLRKVLELAPTPAGDLYLPYEKNPEKLPVFPLLLNQCSACGHVQLGVLVDPSYLYRDYIYTTGSSLGLAQHFARYAASTADRLSLKPGSFIVEIGSNDGTLLREFKNLGMKVLGVDPAREVAKLAANSGVPTIPDFFSADLVTRILNEHGQADLIVANNVMANVADIRAIVSSVRELLSPDGVFVFETGYLKYLAEGCVFDNIHHEHIDYYSIRPLEHFFRFMDMQLFDVVETESKGSSIRCFVGHSAKLREVSSAVINLGKRESAMGYGTPAPYERLGNLLLRTKEQLHSLLSDAAAKGSRVAGFGASVGVTTVLYEFDLGRFIDFLLDDNPARQGLFSPGMSLPVYLAENQLRNDPPDLVVVLSWRYTEQILKTHHKYKNRPTQFLSFFPKVASI